jgi:hypothetical protein
MISPEQLLLKHLHDGEKVLWAGQPERRFLLNRRDFFYVPLGFVWGGLWASVGFTMVVMFIWDIVAGNPPNSRMLFLGMFLAAAGIWYLFKPFHRKWMKRRTYYAVTDIRLLMLLTGRHVKVRELNTYRVIDIKERIDTKGIGSLTFFDDLMLSRSRWMYEPVFPSIEDIRGFFKDVFWPPAFTEPWGTTYNTFEFSEIKEARRVHDLIEKVRWSPVVPW